MTDTEQVGAVAPPPPPVVEESRTMEPVPFARQLFDLLTLHGPMERWVLRSKARFPPGETWREYVRWNGLAGQGKKPRGNEMADADQQYFDRAVVQALREGWLIDQGDALTVGECPPEHTPLGTFGDTANLVRAYAAEENLRALAVLTDKSNSARRKPVAKKRNELRESLRAVGQINPVVRWHPTGREEPLIVDGLTRLELLTELGVTPVFNDLPRATSALHVIGIRMAAELVNSTKDEADEARNAYIALMSDKGFTQASIAQTLGISRQRVAQVLAEQGKPGRREVTGDEAQRMRQLSDGGWTVREIAEETGWSTGLVHKVLTRVHDASATSNVNRDTEAASPPAKPRTKQDRIRSQAAERGVRPGKVYDVSKNAVSVKAAVMIDEGFVGKVVDAESLRRILEHCVTDAELWGIVTGFVRQRSGS